MAETTSTVVPVDALNKVSRQGHKRAADLEPELADILQPLLKAVGKKAADNFIRTAAVHLTADVGPAMPAPRWTVPAPDELLDVQSLADSIRTRTDPVRVAMVETVMTATLKKAGLSFDVSNPFTRRVLEQTGSQIVDISQTTQRNVMRIVRTAYDEGLSINDTAKAIRVGMTESSVTRSKVIARTEMVGAVNGGSLAATQIVASATGTTYNKVWMTARGAKFPRHANYFGLDGQSVGLNDTFDVGGFDLMFPGDPSGPPEEVCNCFPAETLVEWPRLRAVLRRWYEGDMIRVRLATGDVLSGTPNHPVLRADGKWTALGLLNEGDHLVRASGIGQQSGTPDPDARVAKIGEVYDLARRSSQAQRVSLRPGHLHGDASDGEVEVVPVDGSLLFDGQAASDEQVAEFGLTLAAVARTALTDTHDPSGALRSGGDLQLVPAGAVGGERERTALIDGHPLHPQPVRFAAAPHGESDEQEPANNSTTADTESVAHGKDALPSFVASAEIVEIDRYSFSGHVFTLDTGDGWFIANSVAAANCRCALEYADQSAGIAGIDNGRGGMLPDDVSIGAGAPVPLEYVDKIHAMNLDKWPPIPDAAAQRILGGYPSTEEAFSKQVLMPNGKMETVWDNQRWIDEQEAIVDFFFEGKVPSGQKDAFMTSGGSASGKSAARFNRNGKEYSLDDLVGYTDKAGVFHPGMNDIIHIDPDAIKSMISEYKAMVNEGSQYAAYAVHEESSMLAKLIMKRAYDEGFSVVLDGTASSSKFIGKIDEAIANGYKVKVTMVSARTNVAIVRSIDRGDKKGRYVSTNALKDAHSGASRELAKWMDHKGVDEWRVYENSSPTFDSKLIAEGGKGEKTIIDKANWDSVLAKADEGDLPISGSDALRPAGSPVEASAGIEGGGQVVPGGGPGGDIPGAICNVTAAGKKSSCAIEVREMRPATAEERKAHKVPPKWADVQKAVHEDQKVQWTGRDSQGRLQYRYSAAHTAEMAALKFARLKEFTARLDQLMPVFTKDALLGNDAAAALNLIYKTGFRVGSNAETFAKVKAYGATTLRAEHVTIKGDAVTFRFVGKKGVDIEKTVVDRDLAKMLKPRIKEGGDLFDTTDAKVRTYLSKIDGGFKVKDFRTWTGTGRAIEEIARMTPPTNPAEYAIMRKKVGQAVAEELGNTAAVALESYIDPAVFASWDAGLALRAEKKAIELAQDAALRAKGIVTPRMLAEQLVKQAESGEKAVTSTLKSAVKKQGGKMVGLDFRIKEVDSLTRKIASDMEASPSLTVEQAAGAMNDVLRYTAELPEGKYAEGAQAILDSLAKKGYTPIKSKNFWADGNDYKGYHVILQGPGGKVELQFHTEQSLAVKDVNHLLYEKSRVSKDANERYRIWQEPVANSKKIPTPPSTNLFGATTPKAPDLGVQKLMTKDEKKLLGLAAAATPPDEDPKTTAQWVNQFISGISYDVEPSAAEAEAWDMPDDDD